MDIRQLTPEFSVTGQIEADNLPAIVDAGFKSLVCNRPDSEEGAVPHDKIEDAALKAGLEFRFLPVVSGAITEDNVKDMSDALDSLPGPVLAYCRTGGRCTSLFGFVRQKKD